MLSHDKNFNIRLLLILKHPDLFYKIGDKMAKPKLIRRMALRAFWNTLRGYWLTMHTTIGTFSITVWHKNWANQNESPICLTSQLDLLRYGLNQELVWWHQFTFYHSFIFSEHLWWDFLNHKFHSNYSLITSTTASST